MSVPGRLNPCAYAASRPADTKSLASFMGQSRRTWLVSDSYRSGNGVSSSSHAWAAVSNSSRPTRSGTLEA